MRMIRTSVMLAGALLVLVAPGCDSMPTAVQDGAVGSALFSSTGQSRVDLCHRTSSGGYVKITVADAAYSTHTAHGDRHAGPTGECSATLTLHVAGGDPGMFVSVTVAAFGSVPETSLEDCPDGATCYYDIPFGSTVHLDSDSPFFFSWSGCSSSDISWCVAEGGVTARAQYSPY
jgi:hypothetical protein